MHEQHDAHLHGELPNLALYLEEIKYVIDDLLGGWERLVEHAALNKDPLVTNGNCVVEDDVRAAIKDMQVVATHAKTTKKKKCPRILVVQLPNEFQRKLLYQVENLRFLCKGTVTVFPFPILSDELKSRFTASKLTWEQMYDIVQPYYTHVLTREPQWCLDGKFARCAIIVMLYSNSEGDFAWHLWDEENGHWAFPGGDVNRVEDKSLLGTADREFTEENLGFTFSDACDASITPFVLPYDAGPSARYPVQPYVLCRATARFFEATSSRPRFQFEVPPNAVRRGSSKADHRRLHTDHGCFYVEHEWGTWARIINRGAKGIGIFISALNPGEDGPPGSKVRKENYRVFQEHWPKIKPRVFWPGSEIEAAELSSEGAQNTSAKTSRNVTVTEMSAEDAVVADLQKLIRELGPTCSTKKLVLEYRKRSGQGISQAAGGISAELIFERHGAIFKLEKLNGVMMVSLVNTCADAPVVDGGAKSASGASGRDLSRIQHRLNSNGEEESAGAILVRRRPGDPCVSEAYVIAMGADELGNLQYEIPKGHLEHVKEGPRQGELETWAAAAVREFYEETGAVAAETKLVVGPHIGTDNYGIRIGGRKVQKVVRFHVCWCEHGGSPVFGPVNSRDAKEPVGRRWVALAELEATTFKKKGGEVKARQFIRQALNVQPVVELLETDLPEPPHSTWP